MEKLGHFANSLGARDPKICSKGRFKNANRFRFDEDNLNSFDNLLKFLMIPFIMLTFWDTQIGFFKNSRWRKEVARAQGCFEKATS